MPENSLNTSNKAALRRLLLAYRQAIAPEVRTQSNHAICASLLQYLGAVDGSTIGVYLPIRGEPDLMPLYQSLAECGARLALPTVVDREAPLRFIAWTPGDVLEKDDFGVLVPIAGAPLQPTVLLVPCVGFNDARFRLGYGGGFYDRTLSSLPRPRTIGVAYALSRCEFDADAHDVPLDAVITECALHEAP